MRTSPSTDPETARADAAIESEERFRKIFERGPLAVGFGDPDRRILDVNDQMCELLGYTRDDLLGMRTTDLLHPDDREGADERWQRLLANPDESQDAEVRIVSRAGNVRWARSATRLVRKEDGTPQYSIVTMQDVTEQRLAQEELRRSEVIVASSSDMLALLDKEYNYLALNPAYAERFGMTSDQVIGKTAAEVFGAEVFDDLRPLIDECLGGAEVHFQSWMDFPAIGKTYMDVSLFPYVGADGEVRGFVVSGRNITERRQAEEALARASRLNEQILNSAVEGIYGLDMDGNTTFVNPAAAQMIGWESGELIGKEQHTVLHHSRADGSPYPRDECPIYAAFRDGTTHHVESEVFWRKDGTSFPVEYASTPIRDETGELTGAVVSFSDITGRRQAAEALEESEKRYRDLYHDAPAAYFWVGIDGLIHGANRPSEALLGYSIDELVGRPVFDIYADTPTGIVKAREVFARFVAGEESVAEELEMRRADGSHVWVSLTVRALRDADGEVAETRSMAVDITQRKQADRELESLNMEREQLMRRVLEAQEEERTSVAHDIHDGFTQQVVAGQMYLEAFLRDRQHTESPETEAELDKTLTYLDSAITETRRIIAGLRPAALDDIGLASALRQYVEEMAKARGLKIGFRTDVRSRLPDAVESVLYRIAQEALTNAIKHSGSDRVRVTLLRTKDGVSLTVRDKGSGFEPDRVQAGTSGERMGLIGMRERAELLGGCLEIDSRVGEGTMIRADIPLPKAESESAEEGIAVNHD